MVKDKSSSLVWLGTAVFVCLSSLRLSLGNLHHPGPSFLSYFAGLIKGGLVLFVYLQSRKAASGDKKNPS